MGDVFQSGTDRLIHDFLRGPGLRPEPAVGFTSHGTVMQNGAARRFSAADLTAIQIASGDADSRGRAKASTSLGEVELSVRHYAGSENRLVGIRMPDRGRPGAPRGSRRRAAELIGHSQEWRDTVRAVERARATSRPLLLTGESGAGKTSLAMGAAYGVGPAPAGVVVIDAGGFEVIGARRWFERVRGALQESMSVVLCNVETLERRQLTGLRAMLRATPHQQHVTMTLTATERSEAEHYALMFGAHAVEVPALRDRPDDLEALWHGFARRERPTAALGLDAAALEAMQRYGWPGNLRELQTLVAHAFGRRPRGDFTEAELPGHIRNSRTQGLMVQVEQDAIQRALLATGGNRTRAAELLGISRATMYRKAKSFGIPA
jgi:transcriptional regulator of acetoin/glycerol metabolism